MGDDLGDDWVPDGLQSGDEEDSAAAAGVCSQLLHRYVNRTGCRTAVVPHRLEVALCAAKPPSVVRMFSRVHRNGGGYSCSLARSHGIPEDLHH